MNMDPMTTLATLGKSLEVLKTMRDIDKNFDAATYKAKIAELMSDIADAKIALIDAKDQIDALKKSEATLKVAFQRREDCVRDNDFLFERDDIGNPKGMPFCSRCEQADGFLMKLANDAGARDNAFCPRCTTKYYNINYY
jgi:hypothetical protein